MVELLEGEISVESVLGSGSTFTFQVRFKPYDEVEKHITKINKDNLQGKYVLVVDDNSTNRIILTEMLFDWKMIPVTCASALEALRYILGNRYNFSLGLIDICMPECTGTELAQQIKEERPCLPLIALSSLDENGFPTTYFEYKITKPINKLQLLECISKIIDKQTNIGDVYLQDKLSLQPDSPPKCTKSKIKILIAEDTINNLELLTIMLKSLGYSNIDTARDGVATIAKLHENSYHILLLDLRMPKIDGYGVIQYVNEQKINIDIIAVTASTTEEDKEKCRENGVNFFISKPIEMNQLNKVLSVVRMNIDL